MDWGWKIWVCALSVALACSSNDPPTIGDDGGSDVSTSDVGGGDDAGGDDAGGDDAGGDDAGGDDAGDDDAGGDDAGGDDDAGDDAGGDGCSPERACPDGNYCVYGGTCGREGPGSCMPIGDFCPADCPGVCGCDGRMYCNACVAGRSGVDVDPDGDCTPRGCSSSAMCPLSEYCELESCDGDGLCRARPELCPDVIDPVCACNGMTYNNGCEANRAGQSVARAGSCTDG